MKTAKPVVYVSGPMTGYEEFNFPAFNDAANKIRALGYPVVNPADFGADPRQSWRDCLVRDLNALGACDLVVKLPGCQKSKGASLEIHVAEALGLLVVPVEEFMIEAARPEPRKFDKIDYGNEEEDKKVAAAWAAHEEKQKVDRIAADNERLHRELIANLAKDSDDPAVQAEFDEHIRQIEIVEAYETLPDIVRKMHSYSSLPQRTPAPRRDDAAQE